MSSLSLLTLRIIAYQMIPMPKEYHDEDYEGPDVQLTKEQNIALRVQEYDEQASKFWINKALGLEDFKTPYLERAESIAYGHAVLADSSSLTYLEKMVLIMEHPLVDTFHIDWVGY